MDGNELDTEVRVEYAKVTKTCVVYKSHFVLIGHFKAGLCGRPGRIYGP